MKNENEKSEKSEKVTINDVIYGEKVANKKLYITVRAVLHARAKTMAEVLNVTLTELAEDALTGYLDRLEDDPAIKEVLADIRSAEVEQQKALQKRSEAIERLKKLRSK